MKESGAELAARNSGVYTKPIEVRAATWNQAAAMSSRAKSSSSSWARSTGVARLARSSSVTARVRREASSLPTARIRSPMRWKSAATTSMPMRVVRSTGAAAEKARRSRVSMAVPTVPASVPTPGGGARTWSVRCWAR